MSDAVRRHDVGGTIDAEPGRLAPEPAEPSAAAPRTADEFAEFYATHYRSTVRFAFLLVGSLDVAEELAQDCFLRVHDRWDRIESPPAYLRAAVVHAGQSFHRRRVMQQRRVRSLPPLPEGTEIESVELRASLLRLPYRRRAAIVLRFYVGLDDDDIGALLGCRAATVRSLVHRGLTNLREELRDER